MWMWVKNSVLAGINRPYRCLTSGGETLLTLEYVHRTEPAGADGTSCSQVFEAHRVTGALDFVDPAAKDFHLRATSGLIDAADPAAASSGITDLDGFHRGND